ncbi:MAG: hypothetical protein RIR11_4465 [Bacteroidota bacterium]
MINNSLTNEQMKTDEIFESIFNRSLTTVANNKKNANTDNPCWRFLVKSIQLGLSQLFQSYFPIRHYRSKFGFMIVVFF